MQLGVITAGALWTTLFSDIDYYRNLPGLIAQIKAAVGSVSDRVWEEEQNDKFDLNEMRQELERLRADETPQ
eukprot:SAG31_NODE_17214_length_679_cov_0.831034_1_plen_71_part_10